MNVMSAYRLKKKHDSTAQNFKVLSNFVYIFNIITVISDILSPVKFSD